MNILSDKEWKLINNIVHSLYCAESITELGNDFLLLIRKLIPFKSAGLTFVNDDFTVDNENSVIVGDMKLTAKAYNNYAKEDYTNEILSYPISTSYRDTDIIDETQKVKTSFYNEYLKILGCAHLGGLIIKLNERNVCITFYRTENNGPLKERELFILDEFIPHLETKLRALVSNKIPSRKGLESKPEYQLLTPKEKELLPYILLGYTNSELSNMFFISVSTVKKHMNNILNKYHVDTRGQLTRYCLGDIISFE